MKLSNELILIREALANEAPRIKIALGSKDENSGKRFMASVFNTVLLDEKLHKVTPESIVKVALSCAVLGLPIDANQYVYIIPYGSHAQLQISYKGYIRIAKRDTTVDQLNSHIIYDCDEFHADYGSNTVVFIPDFRSKNYGKIDHIVGFYAEVVFKTNSQKRKQFYPMTKDEVDHVRDQCSKTKNYQNTPWSNFYGEMGRKTVIKRFLKHAQLNIDEFGLIEQIDDSTFKEKIINITETGEIQEENGTKNTTTSKTAGLNSEPDSGNDTKTHVINREIKERIREN